MPTDLASNETMCPACKEPVKTPPPPYTFARVSCWRCGGTWTVLAANPPEDGNAR